MKICAECKLHKVEFAPTPDGRAMKMFLCTHPECRDPVGGAPFPCNNARQMNEFCGLDAKHYEAIAEDATVVSETPKILRA